MSSNRDQQAIRSFSESIVDHRVFKYDDACRAEGRAVEFGPFLPEPGTPERFPTLVALARVALELCWQAGGHQPAAAHRATDGRCVEYYVSRFPELDHRDVKLELLRVEIGKRPGVNSAKDE